MQTMVVKKVVFILFLGLIYLTTKASPVEKKSLADSLFQVNKYAEALNLYEDALATNTESQNPSVFLKCAFISERFGDTPKAIYYLSKYQQVYPSLLITDKITKLANEAGYAGYERNDMDTLLTFIAANYFYIIAAFLLVGVGMYYILLTKFFRNQWFLKRHSLLLALYFIGLLFVVNTPFQLKNVIVKSAKTELRKEPSGASVPVKYVKAGDRLLHLGNVDVWSRVRFQKQVYFINSTNCWTLD